MTQSQSLMRQTIQRNQIQAYPEYNLSNQLLLHHQEMMQFLFYTEYDIIYETFELKHAAYLQKKKGEVAKRFKTEEIARHFEIASQRAHIRILRDDIELDKQLSKLEQLWHNHNIPYFHRYYFMKYIFTTYFKNLAQLIANEDRLIREQQHIYYSIFKAINARESCLRQLRKSLGELSLEDVYEYLHVARDRLHQDRKKQEQEKYTIQGYKIKMVADDNMHGKSGKTKLEFFSDLFNHLTKLTLYVIELISKWKEYIYSLTHDQKKKRERVEYYFYDDNYFLKILSDLGFLRVSFLSQFYDFAPKNDPFLLKCILSFQRRQQKTLQNQLLKQIFMPQPEHLTDILSKLQILSEEYKLNIRSRKVYDLNVFKKSNENQQLKMMRNSSIKQPVSNLVLKKLQSPVIQKKSQSLRAFRVNTSVKKQNEKIIVQFKSSNVKRRRNVSLPGLKEKMTVEQETSPLKNSIIVEKNPTSPNLQKVFDSKLLGALKQEVIRKVKAQFALETKNELSKNEELQIFIDSKVSEALKEVFPYQPEKQLKLPLQFTTRTIPEQQVSSQIVKIYKKSIFRFSDMQLKEAELIKKIESSQFIYFVRANIGEQIIGDVICTLDREITEYKALKILYIGFYDFSQLEMLMTRFVEFLWKYENAFEVIYSFMQPANNDPVEQLLVSLQRNLDKTATIVVKQIYSNIGEVRFVFKRKTKNVNYVPNRQPIGIRLCFGALLADKKIMLENASAKKRPDAVCYDYFLAEILRKYISADDFVILKQKIKWGERLKLILEAIIMMEKEQDSSLKMRISEADNVSDLNKNLSKAKELMFQVSDVVKNNSLKLLRYDLSLTLPFQVKSVFARDGSHIQYFRYTIHQRIEYWSTECTKFYIFPTNQLKDISLVFFSAREFLDITDPSKVYLSTYLRQSLQAGELQARDVEKFWVPMFRSPDKYHERQDIYLPTCRVEDLYPIKKDLLIGEQVEFFCNMEMQNGIRFQKTRQDIVIEKPYGLAILGGPHRHVLYARIVNF